MRILLTFQDLAESFLVNLHDYAGYAYGENHASLRIRLDNYGDQGLEKISHENDKKSYFQFNQEINLLMIRLGKQDCDRDNL